MGIVTQIVIFGLWTRYRFTGDLAEGHREGHKTPLKVDLYRRLPTSGQAAVTTPRDQ